MEKIIDALKLVLEKHLIPTVLSLVTAAVLYLYTSDDNWMMTKLSNNGYYLLCAGGFFLLIQLIIYVVSSVKHKIYVSRETAKYREIEEQENLEEIWSLVDHLNDDDRILLNAFLNNGNSAIKKPGGWYSPNSFLNDDQLVKYRIINDGNHQIVEYVLDAKFYNSLKYSQKKIGRISHFYDKEK